METVLLVDDELLLRKTLGESLEAVGYRVLLAANGREAVETFLYRRPDLVLLDVMMPVMDGYGACAEIRKADRETPIIFLSALDGEDDQIRGLQLGANDYVSKTVSDALLLARIQSAPVHADRYSKMAAPKSMTKTEADIYRLLESERGQYFTQREILEAICGEGYRLVDDAIRVHVSNLRRKLPKGEYIDSIRSRGYALFP